ncbi:SDR family oxidoreductase [Nakamurella flavida]|uniref:SDR family oxidoreductase n=1 Tax=Nakamurella flavida TaxID=363630 RepID=A0A938YLQ7_9ACTN|nr:SDR family oxidoreductase [Nakamurella flavida]MBM9475225.1 SDR family oxidoreductase [Nakamurella flavida]MDP9776798.1 3-hydroxybutyrate dehydrogenase [Nakamurella flavida]
MTDAVAAASPIAPRRPRRVLVTGGASGIGRACAEALAALGDQVTVADLDAAAATDVAEQIGGRAWVVDLAHTAALDDLSLDVDVLVNCAGLQRVAPVHEFSPADFRLLHAVMLEAPFLLIRACLPGMYERGWGRIVNLSSVHGLVASEFKVGYVAAKHGLEGLSKAVALEGGPHGVTSNCVNPGYVRTPLVTRQIADQARLHGIDEDRVITDVLLAESANKRLVEPGEVAGLVVFLVGEHSGMINGASYAMDGGWTAR